ncbi:MAG: hypothetical protein GX371_03805 [Bacteroidales bacterium]|jgi:Icc protein|nr:hypothetical protein [Bacteroidales bacterium]
MLKKTITLFFVILVASTLNAQESFRFVFMADVHYHEKNHAPRALDAAIDTINKLNPDFILVGGDIMYDILRRDLDEAEEQRLAFFEKAKKFKAPLYYAIGNHDHFALYNRKVDSDHPLFGKRYYEKHFGARYYSFDHKGWHFITLDDMMVTDDRKYIGRLDSVQLEWLRNDLEQVADTTPVVMMAHVPLVTTLSQWYGGGTNPNGNRIAIENSQEILALFKEKNLKLILQGHIHYFEVLHILNKTTVISAPSFSGKWWMGPMNGMDESFLVIDVENQNEFTYQLIQYQ